jgi:23S rRNA (guanine2445-N2)-methyltransferase / 23S rRNA (guanine2069-N7)-methyltransferase
MECFPGWEAGVFTGNPPLGRALRLRAYRSHTFFNGPLECRLLRFELQPGTVEPDPATARRNRLEAAHARPGAAMFGNRLRKNLSRLEAWAKRTDVACFRVYDADMPEYAFAIDVYGNDQRWACVQEYAAPATVALDAARSRRDEVLAVLPGILGLPEERVVLRVRRRQKGGEQYEKVGEEAQFHTVREGGYRFLVNFTDYLDTGLFLDHRITRRRVGELAAGRSFLNLFAYTGTATVYAAGGGASSSTTVDMSRTYLDWARRNLALNGLAGPQHDFVQADCLAWLEEQGAAPRRRYGVIFVDPPTLSRSKRMDREFDVQRDHAGLLAMAARLLEPGGVIVFSSNFQKFKLDPAISQAFEVEDLTRATLPEDFARNPRIHVCFLLKVRAAG